MDAQDNRGSGLRVLGAALKMCAHRVARVSFSYRYYLLAVLAIIYAVNLTDVWAMGMSLQSIKRDLHLSDRELGLVSGIAFFIFYSAFGIPMGRWSDRGNRVTILAATRIIWATFVVLTGKATGFAQLLLVRMGAGVGEAGCLPPAYSLIADYFAREDRPHALGLFFMSAPFATVLGYMGVGWLLEFESWHSVFTLIGLSGVVLAPLAWLTLKDPRSDRKHERATQNEVSRGSSGSASSLAPETALPPLSSAFRRLATNVTYRNLAASIVANSIFVVGILQWQPAYFVRSFGLKSGPLGMWLALAYGIPGMLGSIGGGRLASWIAGGNERLQLIGMAVVNCSFAVLMPLVYLSHSYIVAFGLLSLVNLAFALEYGPVMSAMQLAVPSRLRGMSVMLPFFFANLIGGGLGPLAVGLLSDYLRPTFGEESLRYALLSMSPWFFWGGWHLWRASRSVAQDIEAMSGIEKETPQGSEFRCTRRQVDSSY